MNLYILERNYPLYDAVDLAIVAASSEDNARVFVESAEEIRPSDWRNNEITKLEFIGTTNYSAGIIRATKLVG